MDNTIGRLNTALEGRYRIERELGAGGMATVYLAQDVRHHRNVALKVLRPELAAVVGSERFLAEIRTTANLQHPHILPLFDSGEADGFLFFVMPYVEGESLRDRLDREGELPVDEAVRIATAVASALDYAHRQGVIHRDIKPANILLHDGQPLVADFGIALAVSAAGGGRLTETGLSLGTPYYMSPEQATAERDPDPRSDVYALGCVLYEMLVGEPPYTGASAQAVLGKILTTDPVRPTEHRRSIPAHVEAAVLKALEKLPADRFSSAAGLAAALSDEAFRHGEGASHPPAGSTRPWARDPRSWVTLAAALLFAVLWRVGERLPADPEGSTGGVIRTVIGETRHVTAGAPAAISPDGRTVVFLAGVGSESRLVRRPLDDLTDSPLEGTEGALTPFFSPDGAWIGFAPDWGVRRVPATGGSVTPVRSTNVGYGAGASWGTDGIYYFDQVLQGIARVPPGGGEPVVVWPPEEGGPQNLVWWSHLPDHRRLLVSEWGFPSRMGVLDMESGTLRLDSTFVAFAPHFVPPATLVFGRLDGTLLAAPFDPERAVVTGPAVPIANDVEVSNWNPLLAVSESGSIVYVRDEPDELILESPDGTVTPLTPERRNFHNWASLSPDGSRVAVTSWDGPGEQLRVYDEAGRGQNLTEGEHIIAPVWSPDGRWLTYGWWDQGVARMPASGGGEPQLLFEGKGLWQPSAWDSAGRHLTYMSLHLWDPMLLDLDSGTSTPFSPGTDGVGQADYSPDGGLLAFHSVHLEGFQVWIQRVEDGIPVGDRIRVSVSGGIAPQWSPDGASLYYIRWRDEDWHSAHLMKVEIQRSPELRVGKEVQVADWSGEGVDSGYRFDIRPDGMIVRIRTAPVRQLVLLQNWQSLLGGAS
jgi:Tol biopolymer transport system component